MEKGQELYNKAKTLIPGGTQLLSKRPEMFLPERWPSYYKKAKGCEIWDLDGKKYIDMSYMGIGSCILGYADRDINDAVKRCIDSGSMNTLNVPEEVELAELLINLHPWAEMTRYVRTGGEAMSVAVRIARAYSRKDKVLFCGYHGWHDWYLSANLMSKKSLNGHLLPGLNPLGVPDNLRGLTIPFEYNDTEGFLKIFEKHKNETGAIVLETIRNYEPEKEFLFAVRKSALKKNIPLIADEITSGFRLTSGGAHLIYGLEPDIAVFAKGISNGFPMAAVIGKKKVMQSAQDSFISSTYWTEKIGPVAAIATIKKIIYNDVPKHLIETGRKVKKIWKSTAGKFRLDIQISGIDPLGHFSFICKEPLVYKTLFTQKMLEQGFLAATAFYSSYSHKSHHIKSYAAACNKAFAFIKRVSESGNPKRFLKGPVCHSGFKRLN